MQAFVFPGRRGWRGNAVLGGVEHFRGSGYHSGLSLPTPV
jgi:hypothetical protein